MGFPRKFLLVIACIVTQCALLSQVPFTRGVNLTGWFQAGSVREIQFTRYTAADINNIKSLGCDVIRLPINLHSFTSGSPSYMIDPLFYTFLDSVVKWCETQKIFLVLDNHSYDEGSGTTTAIQNVLIKVWSQMAEHYRNSSEYVIFEVYNEPHVISTSQWGAIQSQVIRTIRETDQKRSIVVGGSGYNSYSELKNLPVSADTNLIYTFHFYDPFVFTHQGATWVSPSMAPLSGVPFPYNASEMPSLPSSLKGSWIESNFNSYSADGNAFRIKQLIDNAISFRNTRKVKIWCGELGVYIPGSRDADRCLWYKVVRDYLEENKIPWTMWDYQGGFGLFKKNSQQLFDHDLNLRLLDSLGFNVPEQTPFVIRADSTGFMIYSDYTAEKISGDGYGTGTIDFYSGQMPAAGNWCLAWNGFSQYNAVRFDFTPDKDLSRLVKENYALDFIVRGSEPGIKYEIRFKDTKAGDSDRPWRMGTTIDGSDAVWDRKWHHVHIPLSQFHETGGWDNGTWYNPEGKFDWTHVDALELSTEFTDILGKKIWIDNLHITNRDTAIIRETGALGINDHVIPVNDFRITPNPVTDNAVFSFSIPLKGRVILNIFSLDGRKIRTISEEYGIPGRVFIHWDGKNGNGAETSPGLYLVTVSSPGTFITGRLIRH